MKKKFTKKLCYLIVIISLIFNFNIKNVLAMEDSLRVNAVSAIAMDKNKNILFNQNEDKLIPMASTTKIITASVAIKYGDLDDEFTISKNATSVSGCKIRYREGEKITLRELLYGLMMKSGNDAAIAIAEGIAGSEEKFCELMNLYALSIGLVDSNFQCPHGLDREYHYCTAYDLAIAANYAMKMDTFKNIVSSKEIKKEQYGFTRDYNNINKILWQIPEANGIKTGYTGNAGKCLVTSVNLKGEDYIIVVLNSPPRWQETRKIYDYIKKKI